MFSYHELLKDVLEHGVPHQDRTGVGTRSLFGYQWRHSMAEGFPLLTTKKVALRFIFEELMWFLSGSTNAKDLQAKGVTIWDEWATAEQCAKFNRPEGELGPVYGKQFRMFGDYSRTLTQVPQKTPSEDSLNYIPPHQIQQETTWRITDIEAGNDTNGHRYVKIVFGSGVIHRVRVDQVNNDNVSDPYAVTVCGIGYRGHAPKLPAGDSFYKVWQHMLERCYSPTCKEYKQYGEVGVTVCRRWHNLGCFLEDVKNLIGYRQKLANPSGFQLDKDHFRSNVYSPETCIWLPKSMNIAYRFRRPFVATSPHGEEVYAISTEDFANAYGLRGHSIARCLRGERPSLKGWTFRSVADRGLGFTTPVDQVAEAINSIVGSPNSRRIIISNWNPVEATQVELPPCHVKLQIKCYTDKSMSLKMDMRSCDVFLGLPFNIASYALLLEMLALVTGYTARDLVISFSDLHIYNNHIDQVKEQLSRKPYPLPTIAFAVERKETPLETLLGIAWEHVTLSDYQHHDKISAPVAV